MDINGQSDQEDDRTQHTSSDFKEGITLARNLTLVNTPRSGYQYNLRRKVWQTHMYRCVAMSNTVCNV